MSYISIDLNKHRKENEHFVYRNPFPHQIEAFEALNGTYKFPSSKYTAGLLVLPTGAGKTFTAVRWLCNNVLSKGIKVLWLAQSSYLLDQANLAFQENLLQIPGDREFINIRVVSGNPAHSNANSIETTDDILIVTTQTAIVNFNSNALDREGKKYDTYFTKFIKGNIGSQVFVVLDEAHHAPAYGCRNLLMGMKELIPNLNILGLTATPIHGDKRISGWLWKIFDRKIIFEAKQAKLIANEILAIPRYIEKPTGRNLEVDDKLYNRLMKEHKDLPENIIEDLAYDSARNDYIINEYVKNKEKYGKTIIFADRWYQCEYIKAKLLNQEPSIRAAAVYSRLDGKLPTADQRNTMVSSENNKTIADFRNDQYDVLINVRMLTEGVDIPNVKSIFVTRQTTSPILLTQMVGRALRGKKAGGGANKAEANIVLFLDNWKRIINWANYSIDGKTVDNKILREQYPLEYISIRLIEGIVKLFDSGITMFDMPFKEYLPVGWYETERTVSIVDNDNEEMKTLIDYVMVYENNKDQYSKFIEDRMRENLDIWANEKLIVDDVETILKNWVKEYFLKEDNEADDSVKMELVKITQHIAQNNEMPVYNTFIGREKYDLDNLSEQLMTKNSLEQYDALEVEFNKEGYLWRMFYRDFYRFKSAFDASMNRALALRHGGTPKTNSLTNEHSTDARELTEVEKEQVLQRDNNTCLCCGKTRKEGRLEVDHILPFLMRGTTTVENSQTLCRTCNKEKGINEINFKDYHKSELNQPKELKLMKPLYKELPEYTLRRTLNFFYHCCAAYQINKHVRKNGTFYLKWQICLYQGNNPKWLLDNKSELLRYIQEDLHCNQVEDIEIPEL